jgi:hypothetical protein
MVLSQPSGAFFTAKTFSPPLGKIQSKALMNYLLDEGKLRRVRDSEIGRGEYKLRAVYEVTESGRMSV